MKNDPDRIIGRIAKLMAVTRTKYAIIGGVAVSLYGVPRLTLDVDINVILAKKKVGEFLKEAHKAGFMPLVGNELKFANDTGVIPMKFTKGEPFGRCDFIIAQNMLENLAVKRARTKTIGSYKVKVITPEDLILHKLVSDRPRDVEDARGVMLRRKKIDTRYVRLWLRKISRITKKKDLLKIFNSLLRNQV